MSYYSNECVAVSVKGSAETEFTSATFVAKTSAHGRTGPIAKEQARQTIEAIRKAIMAHSETAGVETSKMKTSFSVDVHRNRQTGAHEGYLASYSVTFNCKNITKSLALHDSLTSIDGVESPTPVFNLSDSAEVHARAFQDAVGKARVKFADQCAALGLGLEQFRLTSWAINDEEPRGKLLTFSDGPTAQSVGAEPGKAVLDMRVTFYYASRAALKLKQE